MTHARKLKPDSTPKFSSEGIQHPSSHLCDVVPVPNGEGGDHRCTETHSDVQILSASVCNALTAAGLELSNPNPDACKLRPMRQLLGPVLQLDPNIVTISPHVIGRHGARDDEAFAALCTSISQSGTNSEPVLVRPLPMLLDEGGARYELILGQRRLRACGELGISLRARVEELTATEVLRYIASSHAGLLEHAPIEIGKWAKSQLDAGQFPTAAALCSFTGWDRGSLSKCITLAELPTEVTDLFSHSKGLQHRHASPLNKEFQANKQRLLARAKTVGKLNEHTGFAMTAMQLFDALLLEKKPVSQEKKALQERCANCPATSKSAKSSTSASAEASGSWRSSSPTSQLIIDDDGFEFGDVESDGNDFARTRYSVGGLTEQELVWLAQEQLEMLRRAPFFVALRAEKFENGGES